MKKSRTGLDFCRSSEIKKKLQEGKKRDQIIKDLKKMGDTKIDGQPEMAVDVIIKNWWNNGKPNAAKKTTVKKTSKEKATNKKQKERPKKKEKVTSEKEKAKKKDADIDDDTDGDIDDDF